MATTADFYDGRGRRAVWLGSLQGNSDPDTVRGIGCGRLVLAATDPYTYADAVADLLDVWTDDGLGHSYRPLDGWPWPWPDSVHTDWVYTFDAGAVHVRPPQQPGTHPRSAPRPPASRRR